MPRQDMFFVCWTNGDSRYERGFESRDVALTYAGAVLACKEPVDSFTIHESKKFVGGKSDFILFTITED